MSLAPMTDQMRADALEVVREVPGCTDEQATVVVNLLDRCRSAIDRMAHLTAEEAALTPIISAVTTDEDSSEYPPEGTPADRMNHVLLDGDREVFIFVVDPDGVHSVVKVETIAEVEEETD